MKETANVKAHLSWHQKAATLVVAVVVFASAFLLEAPQANAAKFTVSGMVFIGLCPVYEPGCDHGVPSAILYPMIYTEDGWVKAGEFLTGSQGDFSLELDTRYIWSIR